MSAPAISLVIPTRDRLDQLNRCLDSLEEGLGEILVVDPRARPPAAEDLHRDVRVLRQPLTSVALARTVGALHARNSMVAFLDDDVVAEPGWLAALRSALAATPPPAAVFGAIRPAPGPGLPYAAHELPTRRRAHRLTLPWQVGAGSNMAIDRRVVLRLGGFAVAMRSSGEDTDMILRLLRAGHEVVFEPDMSVLHDRKPAPARVASRGPYGFGMARVLATAVREGDLWAPAVGAVVIGSQLRQMTGRDPQMRLEGRTYLRAFIQGLRSPRER
jgi:glycosyltransferase involved in cell wall biosynthesis